MPSPVAGGTVYFKFTTRGTTGAPTTLSGSPVVSVYKDNSTTESAAGVTLVADFDSRTGLNHVTVDTSADGTFYANGHTFYLTITTGTVGGTSVVGEVVGTFDLAASIANQVWNEVNTGATHNVNNSTGKQLRQLSAPGSGVIYSGTLPSQSGMTSIQVKLDSGASAVDNAYQWEVFSDITGADAGDSGTIISYNGSTKVATVSQPWQVQPASGDTFEITPAAQVQVVSYVSGQAPLQPTVAGRTIDITGGGVTLADGVAHAGETATLTLQSISVHNPSGNAVEFTTTNTDSTGLVLSSLTGAACSMLSSGSSATVSITNSGSGDGLDITGTNNGIVISGVNSAAYLYTSGSGSEAVIVVDGTSTSGAFGIQIITTNANGIDIQPTGIAHGINIAGGSVSGDAVHKTATDGHGDYSAGGNGKAAVVPGTLAIGS